MYILVILFLIASGVLLAYGADKLWIAPHFRRRRLASTQGDSGVQVLNGAPLRRMLKKSDKYATIRSAQEVSRVRSIGGGVDCGDVDQPGDRGGGQNLLPPYKR